MPIGSGPRRRRRILFATTGTLGDLLPFLELGKALSDRGHSVRVACPTGLHSWVIQSGLTPLGFDGNFSEEIARKHARHWNHWEELDPDRLTSRVEATVSRLERNARELSLLARTADLLITPSHCPEARSIEALSGTPWLPVILMPQRALEPDTCSADSVSIVTTLLDRRLGVRVEPVRLTLYACSTALGFPTAPEILPTGFWFYEDPEWRNWRPDERLLRFMNEGTGDEAPLFLSFSSLPLEDPREVLRIHLEAARLLKRRLVVQQGWAGFTRPQDAEPEELWMERFVPADWFLSRCSAFITHGGIGSLGRALRNGCPILIEPYGNDQFYNALLLKRKGYAEVAHPQRLTPEGLACLLREKVLRPEARARVTEAQRTIRSEDGIATAVRFVEENLA